MWSVRSDRRLRASAAAISISRPCHHGGQGDCTVEGLSLVGLSPTNWWLIEFEALDGGAPATVLHG